MEILFEPTSEVIKGDNSRFQRIVDSGRMQCIDWQAADIELWGSDNKDSFSGIDVVVTPCQMGMPIPKMSGGHFIQPPDYCEWD